MSSAQLGRSCTVSYVEVGVARGAGVGVGLAGVVVAGGGLVRG